MVLLAVIKHQQHFQTNLSPPTWVRPWPRALNSHSRPWPRCCPAETGRSRCHRGFPWMFRKKTTGHGDRQAGRPCPPGSPSHLPRCPRGDSGTGKGRGRTARALGHTRRARGRTVFAHAEPCVSTARLPPTASVGISVAPFLTPLSFPPVLQRPLGIALSVVFLGKRDLLRLLMEFLMRSRSSARPERTRGFISCVIDERAQHAPRLATHQLSSVALRWGLLSPAGRPEGPRPAARERGRGDSRSPRAGPPQHHRGLTDLRGHGG